MLEDAMATVSKTASSFLHLSMTACTRVLKNCQFSGSLAFSPDTSHMSYVSNI